MENDTIRVASIAMHSVMGDPSANLAHVAEWAHKAHAQGARLWDFPGRVHHWINEQIRPDV